ncbi:hypothetical protein V7S43_010604 [Phytophthora oleae]|uniref:Uncharacterized protein n=1 Tax=Phytophthora oleae TaxID=2107226 RepID=A0ABD3FBL4_9STRA
MFCNLASALAQGKRTPAATVWSRYPDEGAGETRKKKHRDGDDEDDADEEVADEEAADEEVAVEERATAAIGADKDAGATGQDGVQAAAGDAKEKGDAPAEVEAEANADK